MTTNAFRELAQALVDLQDMAARPIESWPKPESGAPEAFPELQSYPPITEGNARAALGLRLRYLDVRFEKTKRDWLEIPASLRLRVEAEALLIRFERIIAEFQQAVEDLRGEKG